MRIKMYADICISIWRPISAQSVIGLIDVPDCRSYLIRAFGGAGFLIPHLVDRLTQAAEEVF